VPDQSIEPAGAGLDNQDEDMAEDPGEDNDEYGEEEYEEDDYVTQAA
jgi:hypothetical protein